MTNEQKVEEKFDEFLRILESRGMGYRHVVMAETEFMGKGELVYVSRKELRYSFGILGTDYEKEGYYCVVNYLNFKTYDDAHYYLLTLCLEQLNTL